tara:strand:- start:355 stop:534 length:180 start_codon:yes stop_codon:yes gene_type:complete
MSIRPTTKLGYREGARPHRWRVKNPYEVEYGGGEKFRKSIEPRRFAGSALGINLRSGVA